MTLCILNMFSIIKTRFHTVFLLIQQSCVAKGIGKNFKWVQWTCCNLSVHSCYFSGEIWNQRRSRQGSVSSGRATFPALSRVPLPLITCLIDTLVFFISLCSFQLQAFAYAVPSVWNAVPLPVPPPLPSSSFSQLTDLSFQATCEGRPSSSPSQGQVPVPCILSHSGFPS